MKKTYVKTTALAIAAALLLTAVLATSIFAAFFISSVPIDSSILFHKIDEGLSIEYLTSDLTFTHPGDKKEISITLSNESFGYYHYFYGLSLIDTESDGLENAVLVYFDGEFLGTLAQLEQLAMQSGKNEYRIDRDFYILDGSEETPREENHVLTFELHMAAEGSYYENKTCRVNILSYAQNYDVSKVIFVDSAENLYLALYDVSSDSENTNKTVILTSDIVLTKHLEVTSPCTIDLRGHNIVFNGFNINLLHEGILTVKDSKALEGGEGESGEGGFILNNPLGVVDFSDSASFYAFNHFEIHSESGVLQYDKAKAVKLMKERFLSRLSNLRLFEDNAQDFYPFGALYCYALKDISKGGVSVIPSSQYVFHTQTGLLDYPQDLENSLNTFIELDGEEIIFKLAVKYEKDDESVLDTLISEYLQHIPSGSYGVLPSVTYDLFLPSRIDALNATISWKSSNGSLMTNGGKIGEKAEGEVYLTATVRINENVYQHFFNFYVVRQDNEMKFLYLLALLNPITLWEVYPAAGSLYVLPVVDEESEYHYTSITGGKELGLIDLVYEVDPSYYYLQMGGNDGLEETKPNEVYLKEPTFQVYAQVTVTGYFGSGESYRGSIGVRIELGDNTQLLDNVFRHVASYLSSVDVLQNIIDTRVLFGMQREKGDFLLPSSYNGFDIKYDISPSAQGIVSSISDEPDENGKYLIAVDASKFNVTNTAVPITVTVFKSSLEDVEESRELYFNTPPVIKNDELGFADKSVYDAVKLQVWQQLPQNERIGLDIANNAISGEIKQWDSWNYILIRDVKLASTLVFKNGDPENVLNAILDWAVSGEAREIGDVVSYFAGTPLVHISSDGNNFLSEDEKYVIDAFLGVYNGYYDDEGGDLVWKNATQKAYNLTEEVQEALLTFYNAFANLTRTVGGKTDTFVEYMNWARNTKGLLGGKPMSDFGIDLGTITKTNDNKLSISAGEKTDLINAFKSLGFNEFEEAWNEALVSLGLSGEFYVLLSVPAPVSSLPTASKNNVYQGYIYTGTTTSNYTKGHLYIVSEFYYLLGTSYSYQDAGEVVWDAETEQYKGNFSTVAAFENAIVSEMKRIIKDKYDDLLIWAKGSGTGTAQSIASYLADVEADGSATISMEEKAVIVGFWNKVLPAANVVLPGEEETAFEKLWNNTVSQIDVLKDGGSVFRDFYNGHQNDESLTLFNLGEIYYPYISTLDASTRGLSYFTGLKELYVFGDPQTSIFYEKLSAKRFFGRLTTFNINLEKLALQYCSLESISSIGALKNLKYLDLFGNGNLSKIGALTNLELKNLSYLDLHNTGVTYGNNLAIFANIYYGYKSSSPDGVYPDIYYTDGGVRTRFELVPDLNEEQIMILNYLFYLKEIGSSNSKYTLLADKIYISAAQSYGIKWYEEIDGVWTELDRVSVGGAYRYENKQSGTGTSSFTVLRAEMTIGGNTYYRDFEVILVG